MKKLYAFLLLLCSQLPVFSQTIDPFPVVVPDSTATTGIARPFLRVKARGVDNGPVVAMRLSFNGKLFSFPGDVVDTTLDAAFINTALYVEAVDTAGQIGRIALPFVLNTHTGYRWVYTAPLGSEIMDVSGGKVLLASGRNVQVLDTASGAVQSYPLDMSAAFTRRAWLTDEGAYLLRSTFDGLFAWQPGAAPVLLAARIRSMRGYAAGGNAMAWVSASGDSLYFKPGINQPVQFIAKGVKAFDVSKDGALVYTPEDHFIYRYQNGATVKLYTDATNSYYTEWMAEDRGQIAFYSQSITGAKFLRLYNNGSAPLLQRADHLPLFEPYHVKLDSGRLVWVNHRSKEAQWPVGVFLKLPGDTARNIYPSGVNDSFRPLAIGKDNGVLLNVGNGSQIEYLPYKGSPRPLGKGYDKFYDIGGKWYVSIRNALFALDTGSTNVYAARDTTIAVRYNTPLVFGLQAFTDNYSGPVEGPGQLDAVQVMQKPRWGEMYLRDGGRISAPGGSYTRFRLDSIRYEPIFRQVGADTLRWRGSSGTGYSNTATIVFITYPELQAPRIAGLDSNYAANVPSDKIRILNLPPPKWRTQVTVMLDNNTELPVGGDSSFTITPSAYSPGLHYLRITYRHPLDSAVTVARFNVVPVVETLGLASSKPEEITELKAWPNPFSRQVNVQGLDASKRYLVSVHGTGGQVVYSKMVEGISTAVILLDGVPPGMYFLKVFDVAAGRTVGTKQVVKM